MSLGLFPDSAAIADGELTLGGVMTSSLAEIYGTPLVVYCEQTLRKNGDRIPCAKGSSLQFHIER